jgi:hypothetical protein
MLSQVIVDLFPPTLRDPYGIHSEIWSHFMPSTPPVLPAKPLSLLAYVGGAEQRAYAESIAVGESLIDMPLFLDPDHYVEVPLESTYMAAYAGMPRKWKAVLEA